MPKFYVQSGPVELVLQAKNAKEAAIKAFQWSCDRQATIVARSPLEHVQLAEQKGWQLEETIHVSERGFCQADARVFDTLDIVAAWQGFAFPWVAARCAARTSGRENERPKNSASGCCESRARQLHRAGER